MPPPGDNKPNIEDDFDQKVDLLSFVMRPVTNDPISHFSVPLYILYLFDNPFTIIHVFNSKSIVLRRPERSPKEADIRYK